MNVAIEQPALGTMRGGVGQGGAGRPERRGREASRRLDRWTPLPPTWAGRAMADRWVAAGLLPAAGVPSPAAGRALAASGELEREAGGGVAAVRRRVPPGSRRGYDRRAPARGADRYRHLPAVDVPWRA